MLSTHHHWLPVVLAIFLPVTFIITYSIAVGNGHVKPGFPYISDTGTFTPESCVFGQLLNIGAVLCGVIVYIRYKQVQELFGNSPRMRTLLRINMVAFFIGIITNLGISMVGNFQMTIVNAVHLLGSILAFGVGFVYCLLQTIMSYKMNDEMPGNSLCIRRFRVVICVIDAILLIIHTVAPLIASSKGPGDGITHYNWTANEPGYAEHLMATISEWLIVIMDMLFIATFYNEFKQFRVDPPKIVFYNPDVVNESVPNINLKTISQSVPT